MENVARPSASSSRTVAPVILSRSSPDGWRPPRPPPRALPSSQTLGRGAFPDRWAALTMAHLPRLADAGSC